jgi:integrase
MKLTATTVRTLSVPAGKSEAIFFDADLPGFGLRLRGHGSRSFVFQYKIGAKQRRMALGAASAVSIGNARKTAERLYARVKLGEDPASDKADAKARAAETFEATVTEYLDHERARLRPSSYSNLERHLTKRVRALCQLQLAKIGRRDIATVIAAVAKNTGQVNGNRVRTSLSTFFAWAMMKGFVDANPVIGTLRHEEHSRERVLEPSELHVIWNALGDDQFGDIVKLLVLTAQREGEIAGLRWTEIRDDMIVLPAQRTKNHRSHIIPLSQPALAIIAKQRRRDDRDLIFGRGQGGFSAWSYSVGKLKSKNEEIGKLLPWRLHDLRRTATTQMAELAIAPHVLEAVLNHVSGFRAGVAGTYNRSSYEREKRQALNLWAEHLMAIVERRESNVMPLRRA